MAQVTTKFIQDNAVINTKIRLLSAGWLRSRNNANTADINLLRANSSDQIEFGSNLLPATDDSYNLGSSTQRIANINAFNLLIYGGTSGAVNLSSPTAVTSYPLVLPAAQATASGQTLSNDGAGNLTWINGSNGLETIRTITTATDSPTTSDKYLMVNYAGTCNISLPSVPQGKPYVIKTQTGNPVIVTPFTGNIDGSSTMTVSGLNNSASIIFDGTNFNVV